MSAADESQVVREVASARDAGSVREVASARAGDPLWTKSPAEDAGLVAIAAVGAALGAVLRVLLCDWCARH